MGGDSKYNLYFSISFTDQNFTALHSVMDIVKFADYLLPKRSSTDMFISNSQESR